jgi:hypothetical protein
MTHEELFFKLKLRRYLLKVRDQSATRGVLLNNFRQVPLTILDAVIASCISEGLLTVSTGNRDCQVYTWHESAVSNLEVRRG